MYDDADFCGNWYRPKTSNDPLTTKSQSGYVLISSGCPIVWYSKRYTVIALSSIEEDYVSLSHLLIYLIPLMVLIKEIKTFGFEVFWEEPIVHCKEFEDKSGSIELTRLPRIRPCNKHKNVVFHHFR